MKAGWQRKRLDDVCMFLNGLWKGEVEPFVQVGVIRNTNFTKDGTLDCTDIAFLDVEQKKFSKRKLEYGDIILEKSGGGPKQAVGRVIIFDKKEGDFSFSNFTSAIRVNNKAELDFKFLHKFLYWTYVSGVTEKMQSNSTGIRNLDGNAYKSINLEYPPIQEQQRIVAILDKAFEQIAIARANTEKNLQNARALFESHLQNVFSVRPEQVEGLHGSTSSPRMGDGWAYNKLGELVALSELATDITDGDHMPPPKSAKGIPFITISNVNKQSRKIDFSDTFTVAHEYYNKLKPNRKPQKGDVLYTVTGSYGIPIVIDYELEFCFQRHIGLIRPNKNTNSRWLYYLLLSPLVFKQASDGATGTAQKTVSLKVLRNIKVPQMSLAKQDEIVRTLDALSEETQRLESLYQRKLNALDALKKSLLHQAFAGEL